MHEHDSIRLIDDAFADFTAVVAPSVHGVDAAAVHHTVTRRRRLHITAFSALAVLAIAVPIVAYSAMTGGNQGPPDPAASDGPTAAPSPAVETTPPSTPPSSAPPTSTAPPDGRLTNAELLAVRVDLPAWPAYRPDCPSGRVQLKPFNGTGDSVRVELNRVLHTNLDSDAATETAALIECRQGKGSNALSVQVVAFDRGPDGTIVTLGTVVALEKDAYTIDFTAQSQGGVRLRVGRVEVSGQNTPPQVREFAWDGAAFVQISGPRSFS